MLWHDEFNATGVDTAAWEPQVGAPTNAGRYEYDTDRPDNLSEPGDGYLTITTKRESYGGRDFTSARLETRTENFKTGYLEFRAKVDTWPGTAPGLWTDGYPAYGEATDFTEGDVVEIDTTHDPTNVRQTVHGEMPDHSTVWQLGWNNNKVTITPLPGTGWHYYGMFISPTDGSVTFYVDGYTKGHYVPGDQPAGAVWPYGPNGYPQRIIIETEVGLYSGYPDNSRNSDTLQVDYVHLYDRLSFTPYG
jgi:beta-glucanase (GH16 family)